MDLDFLERRRQARQLIIDYKRTFATPHGKNVLHDLMNRFHVLNSHRGDQVKEGERGAVLHILKQCNFSVKKLDELTRGIDDDGSG